MPSASIRSLSTPASSSSKSPPRPKQTESAMSTWHARGRGPISFAIVAVASAFQIRPAHSFGSAQQLLLAAPVAAGIRLVD